MLNNKCVPISLKSSQNHSESTLDWKGPQEVSSSAWGRASSELTPSCSGPVGSREPQGQRLYSLSAPLPGCPASERFSSCPVWSNLVSMHAPIPFFSPAMHHPENPGSFCAVNSLLARQVAVRTPKDMSSQAEPAQLSQPLLTGWLPQCLTTM